MEMLTGAMEELTVGDPVQLSTDVGPVIDEEARASIEADCADRTAQGRLVAKRDAPGEGRFVAPHILRVSGIGDLEREVFGPVLHAPAPPQPSSRCWARACPSPPSTAPSPPRT